MNDLQEWGEMRLESPRGWIWADFSNVGDASDDSSASGEDEEDSEEDEAFEARMLSGIPRTRNRRTSEHRSSDSENMPLPPQRQRVPSNFPTHLETPQPPFDTPLNAPQLPQHRTPQFAPQFTPQLNHDTPTLPRPTPRLPFGSLSPSTAPGCVRAARRPKMPVLRAHLVQIKILENHQNGKDTHLRGLQIFARNDEDGRSPVRVGKVSASDVETGANLGEVGMMRTGRARRDREEVLELGGMGGFDIR